MTLERRKAIFLALVETVRSVLDLHEARRIVAERFGLSQHEVELVEQEGVEAHWPPLGP